LRNVLDGAVLTCPDAHEKLSIENYRKVDDFMRRMMSVVVETPAKQHRILTKGAPESVFGRCTFFELEGELYQMEPILIGDLIELYQDLSIGRLSCSHSCLQGSKINSDSSSFEYAG
jgi:P-type Mg2+ transporter